jgi:aminotransferase
MIETVTGVPVSVPLFEENGFEYDPEKVEELVDKRTRVLLINTPNNPTGRILKKRTLEELADIAVEHDLVVFSDEAYEKFVYDNKKHVSIASLNGMKDRVVTFQSFSKSYAMPGWRVGYAAGPKDIIESMARMHIYCGLCSPTVSQLAAIEALEGDQSCVEKMKKEYDRRRKLIVKRIEEIPKISCLKPEGAFYAFPNVKELKMKSTEIVRLFLKKAKVLTVPGTEFGRYGEGYIRLSYATSYEKIEEALNRIEDVVRKLK